MLVLSRKQGQRVVIGQDIVVTVIDGRDGRIRLGFEAPRGMPIHREEIFDRIERAEVNVPARPHAGESPCLAECG